MHNVFLIFESFKMDDFNILITCVVLAVALVLIVLTLIALVRFVEVYKHLEVFFRDFDADDVSLPDLERAKVDHLKNISIELKRIADMMEANAGKKDSEQMER